jgi:hypothetical protein
VPLALQLSFALALLTSGSFAMAQSNLGALLDAGAARLSAEEFRRELLGRQISGFAANGQQIQIVYLESGEIRGAGGATGPRGGATGGGQTFDIQGTYTIDDSARMCTTMQLGRTSLAPRCQYWYRLDRQYFLSDSDSDRSARVHARSALQ